MYMDYAKFDEIMAIAQEVFAVWDENMKDFTNVAREGMLINRECITVNIMLTSSLSKADRKVHLHQDQPGSCQAAGARGVSAQLSPIARAVAQYDGQIVGRPGSAI